MASNERLSLGRNVIREGGHRTGDEVVAINVLSHGKASERPSSYQKWLHSWKRGGVAGLDALWPLRAVAAARLTLKFDAIQVAYCVRLVQTVPDM